MRRSGFKALATGAACETVTVELRERTGTDAHGNAVYACTELEVPGVLAQPGAPADIPDGTRPDGHKASWTLHFPEGFEGDLEGLRVKVRGVWHETVGAPQRVSVTPWRWNMEVKAVRCDG